ncbi:MAG: cytochrome c [Deltaproteobacteria bacterium]|nr:cytochrome c [Deltaproteobacteria bacterium]
MRRLAATLLLLGACTPWQWDPMKKQGRPSAYEPSSLFPDGRAMRTPPAGSVAREDPVGPVHFLEDEPDGGGFVEGPRPPLTAASLDRGEQVFDRICAACHGLRGDGVSRVAQKMSLRPPPSLLAPPITQLGDHQLFAILTEGYGLMPAMRGWLTPEDRWNVISYVHVLQLASAVPAGELSSADRAELGGAK